MKKLFLIVIFILISKISLATTLHSESWYQQKFCSSSFISGQMEYVLSDDTRIDCYTKDVAWEVEFASKWYESVGQSLHYGKMTGKKPGIILILEKLEDVKYLNRLISVNTHYGLGIEIYVITP